MRRTRAEAEHGDMRKWILRGILASVVLLVVIQLVPYGRNHSNPPVTQEVKWDSSRTRELAVGACYDCHSNETVWPWYSNVAPVSWLVYADVKSGRETLNFSEWDRAARRRWGRRSRIRPQRLDAADPVQAAPPGRTPHLGRTRGAGARAREDARRESTCCRRMTAASIRLEVGARP